jgi:excisionase family DNA binding protein
MTVSVRHPEPLLHDVKETAVLLHVSARTVWRMIADGTLPIRKIRGRRLIPAEAINALAKGDN